MKAFPLAIALGAAVAAQHTALWVPECGDEVLMLGTQIASNFHGVNTVSVANIDTILAFQTYTVIFESSAPAGFKYDGEFLVKDPPSQHIVTTCTSPRPGTGAAPGATPASSPPTGPPPTGTQVQPANTAVSTPALPSIAAAPTSCYTTGQPMANSASVMNMILSFCGLYPDITMPTSISSTMTYNGVRMLFEVNSVGCQPVSIATEDLPVRFGRPGNSRSFNKALWPCVKLYEIWEYCNGNGNQGNEGRGGFGAIGCNEFGLKPPVVSNLSA